MAVNLLDLFRDTISDQIPGQMSSYLGESTESTRSAIGTILPSILGGLVQKGHSTEGAASILEFFGASKIDGSILDELDGLFAGGQATTETIEKGSGILEFILGNSNGHLDTIVDLVTQRSGIGRGSSNTLIKMIAPLLTGILGKKVKEMALDTDGLQKLLNEQKESIEAAAPTGLFDQLGYGTFIKENKLVVKAPEEDQEEEAAVSKGPSLASRTVPWIILISIALLLLFVMRTCGGRSTPDTVIDKTVEAVEKSISDAEKKIIAANEKSASIKTTTDSITGSTRSTLGGVTWIKLPGGKEIEVPEGSFIDRLYVYLGGGSGDANSRFTFDKLVFQTATANIALTSANQVQNVADILTNFSNAHIRIEAHTDSAGEPIANKILSEQRALAVKFALNEWECQMTV
ncbi:MAG: DUF937 domain-containing protein [Saprospiraceae bacterium]|nr:DUF937 domain-containing protein [Saprospiraceae bacterium]